MTSVLDNVESIVKTVGIVIAVGIIGYVALVIVSNIPK
jgi:hypothetical protein